MVLGILRIKPRLFTCGNEAENEGMMNEKMRTYVVTSGRPAGEIHHRFVAIVEATSQEMAVIVVKMTPRYLTERYETQGQEWLWGPHAWFVPEGEDPVAYAEYDGTSKVIDLRHERTT